ncbi:hypothetical protein GCM10007901_20460 [Dyella acidisoli]|uniref:Uncharacterized protein n=1 Tax=Dyella acidisoli TaxID=1867834 RepID=A0ABQ5XN09_9GAMM|nr:hypothetical protein GCM10007901_20460 [Dyella acidisoli]
MAPASNEYRCYEGMSFGRFATGIDAPWRLPELWPGNRTTPSEVTHVIDMS